MNRVLNLLVLRQAQDERFFLKWTGIWNSYLDDERLKNPEQPFYYFNELLWQIQDIRTSEKRFYHKIADIYATSVDHDPAQQVSIDFFKTVQNKLHWATTGNTSAPRMTPSIRSALRDLNIDEVIVVYPGGKRFSLAERLEAVPLKYLAGNDYFHSKE